MTVPQLDFVARLTTYNLTSFDEGRQAQYVASLQRASEGELALCAVHVDGLTLPPG